MIWAEVTEDRVSETGVVEKVGEIDLPLTYSQKNILSPVFQELCSLEFYTSSDRKVSFLGLY